jgi:ParB family transcriptional regulator, chromosome partitioning protein
MTPEPQKRTSRLDLVRGGQSVSGTLKLPQRGRVRVDIDAIVPDPRNERKTFHGIDELAASILQVGIVEPPTVVPSEDGRYMLTTGERRWRAAKKAGLQHIYVIVCDPEHERKRRIKSLVSNVHREDLSAIELAHALQEMKEDNPDINTNRDLAAIVGKTEQWVGQMLKVLSLPEKTQTELREAPRPIAYDSVVQIARVQDPTEQKRLVKIALSGATVKDIREHAREAKTRYDKAGKRREPAKQKINVSGGWVIVHLEDSNGALTDFIAALAEALKNVRKA